MNMIDIEILNETYNSPARKAYDKFNSKMQKKREKRLAKKDKKPLSPREEFLYETRNPLFNNFDKPKGFYVHNGKTHIFMTLTKTQMEAFYFESKQLVKKYPANYLIPTIMDDNHFKSIMGIFGLNGIGLRRVCELAPTDVNLSKYIKMIFINTFGMSYDSACIDFEVYYTDFFINSLNRCMCNGFESDIEYKKTYINGKESISHSYPFGFKKRAEYVDDVLFEIKSRFFDFLKLNYSAFDFSQIDIPYSIEEFRTNLDPSDGFLMSYDYIITNGDQFLEPSCCKETTNCKKEGVFMDNYNVLGINDRFYNPQRGRLLFFVKKDESMYIDESIEYVIRLFLQSHLLDNYKATLNKKFSLLEKLGNGNCFIARVFGEYSNLCLKVNEYQSMLNFKKIKYVTFVTNSVSLKKRLEYLESETNELNSRNADLDSKINNLLTSKNNATSMNVALIALIVSIISVLVSIAAFVLPFFINNVTQTSSLFSSIDSTSSSLGNAIEAIVLPFAN